VVSFPAEKENRPLRLLAFLTALFALVWADGVARAEPTVRVAVEEYPVLGRTGGEIMKEINRKGPRHGFLVRAIAQTRYALDYRYEAVEAAGSCRVASATVELDIA
jgi:predicted secreted Zn-dependent protease